MQSEMRLRLLGGYKLAKRGVANVYYGAKDELRRLGSGKKLTIKGVMNAESLKTDKLSASGGTLNNMKTLAERNALLINTGSNIKVNLNDIDLLKEQKNTIENYHSVIDSSQNSTALGLMNVFKNPLNKDLTPKQNFV